MPNIKISELPAAASVATTDVLIVNQGTDTKKATLAQALVGVLTTAQIAGLATTAPAALSTSAVIGLSTFAARADHRHIFPTLEELGAQAALTTSAPLALSLGGTGQISYTNGQLLIGDTATSGLSKATLTAGNGIVVTNGAGSISLGADFGTTSTKVTQGGTTVLKSGDTMTGKLVLGPSGTSAPLNLGANTNPTPVGGDMWMSNTNVLTWRGNNGATYPTASTVAINSFAASQIISVNVASSALGVTQGVTGTGSGISVDLSNTASTAAAVRITNLGTGDCLKVEDSTTPDATPFVVNAAGRVGVGLAADSVAAANLDSGGIKLNNAGATLSATISVGSGSPEGVVTANPGSLYLNLSGGANTSLFVKESGTATNTGWVGK